MLVDASALLALLEHDHARHHECIATLDQATHSPVTTIAALTEAMHLLGSRYGWHGQSKLASLLDRQVIRVDPAGQDDLPRTIELMRRYRDQPMDFADATLVALAERLLEPRILTLDKHFAIYRFSGRRRFEPLPA